MLEWKELDTKTMPCGCQVIVEGRVLLDRFHLLILWDEMMSIIACDAHKKYWQDKNERDHTEE